MLLCGRRRRRPSTLLPFHVQDLLERPPEVHVAPGVYDRIDRGVQVAEPRDHVDERLGRRTARFAEREEQIDDEERQPADDEHAHDDAQRLGGLPFLGQRYALLVLQQLVDVFADRRGGRRLQLMFPALVVVGLPVAGGTGTGGRVHLVAAARRLLAVHVRRGLLLAVGQVLLGRPGDAGRGRPLRVAIVRHGHLFGTAPETLSRGYVNPQVCDAHHHQRYVKRSHGRVQHVAPVRGQLARGPLVEHVRPVVPADQRRRTDHRARDPHQRHRPHDPRRGAFLRVRYWLRDGLVPVQRDGAQVQYGRGAAHHVARQPQLAHHAAEQPHSRHVVHDVQRQHADGHHQVGHGQRHDEYVGHGPQRRILYHAHDDQYVAENGGENEHRGRDDDRRPRGRPRQFPGAGRVAHDQVVRRRVVRHFTRCLHCCQPETRRNTLLYNIVIYTAQLSRQLYRSYNNYRTVIVMPALCIPSKNKITLFINLFLYSFTIVHNIIVVRENFLTHCFVYWRNNIFKRKPL